MSSVRPDRAVTATSTACLTVEVGGCSKAGVKPENQDAFAVKQPASRGVVDAKGYVACLADGVSSCAQARLASETSVVQFIEDYYCTPDSWSVKQAAGRVLTALNSWLVSQGRTATDAAGMVCTFSSVVFKSASAHVFHAGDSRVYRYRNGNLEQITRDHCQHQGARKSFLTRGLGMDEFLDVDYQVLELEQDDVFLFSSDGIHDFLSDKIIRDKLAAGDSLESTAENIVESALGCGSDDNLTCLLVKITAVPQGELNELERQLAEKVIPPALAVSNKIDQFEVVRVLHSGARSHLYLVENVHNRKRMVLKAPSLNFADDPVYLDGFIREEWVGRRINHPSVMSIFPGAANSPYLYHLCEYIEGATLRQWMYDHPKPTLDRVRALANDLVVAVRQFQRQGMVHRDLKPENIMLTELGRLVIIDFGTVRSASQNDQRQALIDDAPAGSVGYTAPEYLRGEQGTHVSDIFSVGVILYELLCGELPFEESCFRSQYRGRWQYRSIRQVRENIPLWVDLALEKACAPSPSARYQALSELLGDLSVPNQTLMSKYERAPLIERNPLLFWQGMTVVLLVMCLIQAYWIWSPE